MPNNNQLAKIYLATDHAGYDHKNSIASWLLELGYAVEDCGAYELDSLDDFDEFVATAARQVSQSGGVSKAIIFGGSGQGEAMMANRFAGVRATVYYGGSTDIITLSREHNDANVLSIGARFVSVAESKSVIETWLSTDALSDEKYRRRNDKLDALAQ